MKKILVVALLGLLLTPDFCWGKPNILVVIADDMDWVTFNATPGLAEIASQGVLFNAVTSTPLCGPSRASILTGRAAHNHRVLGNERSAHNAAWYANVLGKTFADYCQGEGYRTVMAGKYANPFDQLDTTGWDSWIPPEGRGERQVGPFWHDVMVDRVVLDIEAHPDQPTVVWYSSTIPHGPLIPSNAYAGVMAGLTLPKGPSFNEADVSDKVSSVALLPLFSETQLVDLEKRFQRRVEMSLSLVDGIRRLTEALSGRPLYVFFVSDNGFFEGQHRIFQGKGLPYEEAIRVPMFVVGEGVTPGVSPALVYAGDIAPTVTSLCEASPREMDTHTLIPLLSNHLQPWRKRVLAEHGWHAIRTEVRKLVRFSGGARELYHLGKDPYELLSRSNTLQRLETYLDRMLACLGEDCWRVETE